MKNLIQVSYVGIGSLKNFKENVIVGIGWNGYKYQFIDTYITR